MRRLTVIVVALALAATACEDEVTVAARAAPAATKPALTSKQRDACRDQCEQGQIVAGTSDDAQLRACRARCDAQAGVGALAPHEVPSRITVAPAARAPRRYTTPATR
jgi:hypothetical protein